MTLLFLAAFPEGDVGTVHPEGLEVDFNEDLSLNPPFTYENHSFVPNRALGEWGYCGEISVITGWHFISHEGSRLQGRYGWQNAYVCILPAAKTALLQSYPWHGDHDDEVVADYLWLGLKQGLPQLLGMRQESGNRHMVLVVGWSRPYFIVYDPNRLALTRIRYDQRASDLQDYVHPADPDYPYAHYRYYNWHPDTHLQMESVFSLCPAGNPQG